MENDVESFRLHTAMTEDESNELKAILASNDFSDVNVFIATPCYGGQVSEAYMRGILDVTMLLQMRKIPYYIFTIGNESLITRARNSTVATFMGNPEFTHLLFIDADIEFTPVEFFRLLAARKEVAGGCYPGKAINWDKLYNQVSKGCPRADIEAKSLNYIMDYHFVETEQGRALNLDNGFVEVKHLATGFLMIQRTVFDKLIEAKPQDKYMNDIPGYNNERTKDKFYLFFDTMCDDNGRYLSEDYAFCKKWRSIGGQIWMDLSSRLTHTGYYKFKGNLGPVMRENLGM